MPQGQLFTYGDIPEHLNKPTASRAVATAIGSNAIAFLIPCHGVIQKSGQIGGYVRCSKKIRHYWLGSCKERI
ncbi:MAG: methylated-DNA--[protein]-cysteine S-methyltransferase [Cellvibrionaceae bacterium]|nr:methylated-DNA--[protein]-cysteine S-methyltransferase [Cellvibrionaceae bacterium]